MITASIVIYHPHKDMLVTLLDCVKKSNSVDKLWVIDNAPKPDNAWVKTYLPYIEYIENENTGYGHAHNIALRKAVESGSTYHVVLNPDIEFAPDALKGLAAYMDSRADAGWVMPKIIYPNGEIQYLCKKLPTPFNLFLRRFLPAWNWVKKMDADFELRHTGYNKEMNVPFLSGCFMFLRVETISKHQLYFDERFFMYCEDLDLSRRFHAVSKTMFNPAVTIIHNHERASYKSKKLLLCHVQSACKYFCKWGWIFDKERKRFNKENI
jgi:GT2 family glycosyltransferase